MHQRIAREHPPTFGYRTIPAHHAVEVQLDTVKIGRRVDLRYREVVGHGDAADRPQFVSGEPAYGRKLRVQFPGAFFNAQAAIRNYEEALVACAGGPTTINDLSRCV